jgi:hypothetical protein
MVFGVQVMLARLQRQLRRKGSRFLLLSLLFLWNLSVTHAIGDVIWAVNCGGEAHTDVHGIRYEKDPAQVGIASDYGKTLMIDRVVPQDQILYQTERYHMSTFGYDIPIREDGDYVLVLKFCEVWFTSPNKKVINIMHFWSETRKLPKFFILHPKITGWDRFSMYVLF